MSLNARLHPRPEFQGLDSVVFFVDDIDAAAAWYAELFGAAVEHENPRYAFITLPALTLGFHPADLKCPAGGRSQAVYFKVPSLGLAVQQCEARGALRHRGPGTTPSAASSG